MNNLRNLIVVCQACHDKHHAGELEIGPQKQTSSGPQRVVTTVPSAVARKVKVKWTEDEQKTIDMYLRKFPHLSISRLVYDLKQQEDIVISEGALRKLKQSLL